MIQRGAPRRGRGFTLVELMITVAVVGVLAVIGTVAYTKFVRGSHVAEANNVLSGIKTREEAYRGEMGSYLGVSTALASGSSNHASLYPMCTGTAQHPGKFATQWGAACPLTSCCNADWKKLGVTVDAPVFYGYSAVAGAAGASVPSVTLNGSAVGWPNPTTDAWFVASAVADVNGNAVYSTVMLSSFDNTVMVENPDE